MTKEVVIRGVNSLAQRTQITGIVDEAIEELKSFPPGIMDEYEAGIFANAVACLEEARIIARKKGIELGLEPHRRSFWDRFKRSSRPQYKEFQNEYKGMPIHVLAEGEASLVVSDTGCQIVKSCLGNNRKVEVVRDYDLPYRKKWRQSFVSRYGWGDFGDFIAFGAKKEAYPSCETLVRLIEYKRIPLFIIHHESQYDYGGAVPIASYAVEPTEPITDPGRKKYHVRFIFPDKKTQDKERKAQHFQNEYLLEIEQTYIQGKFKVRELKEIEDPMQFINGAGI